jgi:hypothetical protein
MQVTRLLGKLKGSHKDEMCVTEMYYTSCINSGKVDVTDLQVHSLSLEVIQVHLPLLYFSYIKQCALNSSRITITD